MRESRKYNICILQKFNAYFQLNDYIDAQASEFDFVKTISIGNSYEGRDMRVIQITKAGSGALNIWIEAGIHAR